MSDRQGAVCGALLALLLSACSVTSQDSDLRGMQCLRGHDELVESTGAVEFFCDEWVPSPGVTP